MIIWYLLISVPTPIYSSESQFECGDHGRFEYCIDGIPGCIIGCHCHPGYYFDTDTKICEPNSKLSQAYRRRYSGEPTRIYHANSFELLETSTHFSTPNEMDDHVDAIAQNADDLGDWLYNQFFKTIEKQVINKTDNKVITRRSGKSPIVKARKKKGKKEKKTLQKRKKKQDDLRRKLLRITEDDSLFNSDTDGDTDTDTDDDDSSHSSSSDETRESDKDKEHGHKKFVIVNKKPKPPLPSFIFLPNIETPFYPPVGLPPPVLPMYPMVPVPPMLPPPFFPHALPDCDTVNATTNAPTTSASTQQSTSTSVSTISTVSTNEAVAAPTTNSAMDSASTDKDPSTTGSRKRLRRKKNMREKNDILRRLRELVEKTEPEKLTKKPQIYPPDNIQIDSLENIDEPLSQPVKNNFQFRASADTHAGQKAETANFKYLSELIHHWNVSKNTPVVTIKPSYQRLKTLLDLQRNNRMMNTRAKIVEPSRRFDYNLYTEPSIHENEFYTNLGKQIASLIRGVDTKYDRQINIEIEHMNKNIPSNQMFNEVNNPSNSYWERFARSPVNDVRRYDDKMKYFNKDNEALYKIESIVERAASTLSPMSLVELENVVNVIEKPLNDIERVSSYNKIKDSHNTLNINLWPQLPLTNPILNVVKPPIEHFEQHLNCTNEQTTERQVTYDFEDIPAKNNIKSRRANDNSDYNLSSKIQNYTMDRKSNEIIRKRYFPNEGVQFYITKPPENHNRMDLPKRQHVQIPHRRSNVKLASISPLFDFNAKMHFYSVNNHHPYFSNVPKQQFPLIHKSINTQPLLATPRSYFNHGLGAQFGYIE